MDPALRPNRAVRRLWKSLAARCRGKTAVVGAEGSGLTAAIRRRGLEPVEGPLADSPPESFGTVVLAGVLEGLPEEEVGEVLAQAWALLRPGGRLIVSVPNEGCARKNGGREFDRKSLKRLLRPLRRPRLATDQPFRFLVMYSDKP